ncbi:MAG: hypothetical protein ACO3H5_07205 [Candidatus Nanopelagicales bacterium]
MNSQELRNLQEAYLEVYQNQNISEDPIQDYRDRRRAAENKSGLRGPELSNSGSSKGTPKPGSASVSTSGPSSPGYDTRRLGGSDLRRLPTPSPTLQSKGTYKPGSASVSKPVRSREFAREDMFDLVKGHLLDEGYADTEEAAIAIMANMSEEWRESIFEAEVLAMKGGVPGSVRVKPALSIPGTSIGIGPNRPVPGTFTTTTPGQREKIKQGDTQIDRGIYKQSRVGAGPTQDERKRYNAELVRQDKRNARFMRTTQ